MKLPLVVTTASIAMLLATQADAAPTGAIMNYTSSIVITGIAGSGSATGVGEFDDSGTLTISADTFTSLPPLPASATVSSITVYNGSITGTTWTGDGTTTVDTTACIGDALICGSVPIGIAPGVAPVFSVDINTGGTWNSVSSNPPVTLTASNTLSLPVVLPPGDPNAIPTMSVYGLGMTIVALLGIALRRLRSSNKRT